jgi:hypothetical protein
LDYFSSIWGLSINSLILVIFGLASYNKYANRWSAKTGNFNTPGHITWSEIIGGQTRKALISYSYYVESKLYNGEISAPPLQKEQAVIDNPKGKEIVVYYSDKDHGFSRANKPPSHQDIIGSTIVQYLLLPFVLLNIPLGYFYWLFSVSK